MNKTQHIQNKISIISNKKKKNNTKTRLYLFCKPLKINLSRTRLHLNLLSSWDFVIIRSSDTSLFMIYLFNSTYFFKFSLSSNNASVIFDTNSKLVVFTFLFVNNFYKLYWKLLVSLFSIMNRPFFKKLKFKGKGYYIFKNKRNTVTPQFGYAHRIYIYSYFLNVKFLSKTSIFIFGLSSNDIVFVSSKIKSTRPINIFTGRGVRFSREVIYKKQGKVSSYR